VTTGTALDRDRFVKVHKLAQQGATQGERDAAIASATRLARAAGHTLSEAIAKAHVTMDDTQQWRDPRSPAEQARQHAIWRAAEDKRDEERRRLAAIVIARHGSMEALFAPTAIEIALDKALDAFAVRESHTDEATGVTTTWVDELVGCGEPLNYEDYPQAIRDAAEAAHPIPDLAGGLAEYESWEALADDRAAVDRHHDHSLPVAARHAVLRHVLETRPSKDWADYAARASYMGLRLNETFVQEDDWKAAMFERMAKDLATLKGASDAESTRVNVKLGALMAEVKERRRGRD
jgi:hypothetical protein